MGYAGYVDHMADRRDAHTLLWLGDLRERDHLEHTGADGRIILKWMFNKCDGEAWAGLIWLRIGTSDGRL